MMNANLGGLIAAQAQTSSVPKVFQSLRVDIFAQ
jgi:hypothetical protein